MEAAETFQPQAPTLDSIYGEHGSQVVLVWMCHLCVLNHEKNSRYRQTGRSSLCVLCDRPYCESHRGTENKVCNIDHRRCYNENCAVEHVYPDKDSCIQDLKQFVEQQESLQRQKAWEKQNASGMELQEQTCAMSSGPVTDKKNTERKDRKGSML